MTDTNINIIDIEASGLEWESYPIEVAVRVDGRLHNWLIKPLPQWTHWCETAEGLHGISREQLAREGEEPRAVAEALNSLLVPTNTLVYSDAARWDSDWLHTLYDAVQSEPAFTLLSIYDFFDPDQDETFKQEFERLTRLGAYRQHRAADDVEMIYQAYCHALKTREAN